MLQCLRLAVLSLILLVFSFPSYSQDLVISNYLPKSSMGVGSTLHVQDNLGVSSSSTGMYSRKSVLKLSYTRESQSDIDDGTQWRYIVTYSINGVGGIGPESGTLELRFNYSSEYVYEDLASYVFGGSWNGGVDVSITGITAQYKTPGMGSFITVSGSSVASNAYIPSDIRLELWSYVDIYLPLDISASSGGIAYDTDSTWISWQPISGAREYDVEWVFIDFYDSRKVDISVGAEAFATKEPVRIRTGDLRHRLDLVYPEGTVYFRYRGVGSFLEEGFPVRTGGWIYANHGGTDPSTQVISSGYESGKNWQFVRSYAEDGKNKSVISYRDGTNRGRQTLTTLSTDRTTVIAQGVFDYEGRQAATLLPSVEPGENYHYRSAYYKDYSSGQELSALHIEGSSMPEVSNASGTGGAYYSTNNPFVNNPLRSHIPQSRDLMSLTEYMNDNTGRVRSVTNPGDKVGSGRKQTRYLYGTPTGYELQRLFGSNVGKASHYKKQVVYDANDQISVVYQDQAGRTIATALAGDSPTNLHSIAPSDGQVWVDLMESNVVDAAAGTSISTTNLVLSIGSTLELEYSLQGALYSQLFTVNGSSTTVCRSCRYELEMYLETEDGDLVSLEVVGGASGLTKLQYEISATGVLDCNWPYYSASALGEYGSVVVRPTGNATLPKGVYHVVKVLRSVTDESELDLEVDSILTQMGITLNGLTTLYESNIDYSGCDYTCEQICERIVLAANPSLTGSALTAAIDTCVNGTCGGMITPEILGSVEGTQSNGDPLLSKCTSILVQMTAQVSPGGHYFREDRSTSDFWSRVSTLMGTGDIVCPLAGGGNATYSVVSDSLQWESQWADELVKAHREYCHYEACLAWSATEQYGMEMMLESTYAGAVSKGYLPSVSGDPLMNSSALVNQISFPVRIRGQWQADATAGSTYASLIGDYDGNGSSLWNWINDTYGTNLTLDQKWLVYRGILKNIKRLTKRAYLYNTSCSYYQDEYAVVKEESQSDIEDPGVQQQIEQQGLAFATDCEGLCDTRALTWIEDLIFNGHVFANTSDSIGVYTSLYDYCVNYSCGADNPLGLILSSNSSTTAYQNLATALSGYGVSGSELSSLAVSGTVYGPCNDTIPHYVYDDISPVFDQFVLFLNNEFLDIGNTGINFTSISTTTYPLLDLFMAAQYHNVNTPGSYPYDLILTGNDICQYGFVTVSTNQVIKASHIISIGQAWVDVGASPSTPNAPGWQGNMQYASMRLIVNTEQGPVEVYLFELRTSQQSRCLLTDSLFTLKEVPCMVSGVDTTYLKNNPYSIEIDLDSARADCMEYEAHVAQVRAAEAYSAMQDSIREQMLIGHFGNCMEVEEAFTARYVLKEYHYTLYYYDQAGNLVQTVPPAGVDVLGSTAFPGSKYNGTTQPNHVLKTRYLYNANNTLREQLTPDGGLTKFYYDELGRLRFSVNAKQRSNNTFSYTKYDDLGRVIEVGESDETNESSLELYVDNLSFPSLSHSWERAVTEYDGITGNVATAKFSSGSAQNLRGRVASVKYYQEPSNPSDITAATYYSYDIHGNVSELVQELSPIANAGSIYKYMKYEYDLLSGNVNQVSYQPGEFDEFYHRYVYDADNRIRQVETSRDGLHWAQDASYIYYPHGPLGRVELGEDGVQGTDYAYTLQGWLKGVNSSTAHQDRDMGRDGQGRTYSHNHKWMARDAYGFSLDYHSSDYTPISTVGWEITTLPSSITSKAKHSLYNGNIAGMTVALSNTSIDGYMPVQYKWFQYDQLNRIVQQTTYERLSGSTDLVRQNNALPISTNDTNHYRVNYGYDGNGNIEYLQRYRSGGTLMDNLSYGYNVISWGKKSNNQLKSVTDASSSSITDEFANGTADYYYDAIGNLVSDTKEEILGIEWLVSGKVESIARTSGSSKSEMTFYYDAMGNRIAKAVRDRPSGTLENAIDWEVEYVVRDASGNVMARYEETYTDLSGNLSDDDHRKSATTKLSSWDIYGSSRLGTQHGRVNDYQERVFQATSNANGFTYSIGTVPMTLTFTPEDNIEVVSETGVTISATGAGSILATLEREATVVSGLASASGGDYVTNSVIPAGTTVTIPSTVTLNTNGGVIVFGDYEFTISSSAGTMTLTRVGEQALETEIKLGTRYAGADKSYELTNHLGNVYATVSDRKIGVGTEVNTTVLNNLINSQTEVDLWDSYHGGSAEFDQGMEAMIIGYEPDQGVQRAYSPVFSEVCTGVICVTTNQSQPGPYTLMVLSQEEEEWLSVVVETPGTVCFELPQGMPTPVIVRIISMGYPVYVERVTFEQQCTTMDHYVADVQSAQDYYPFGMIMPGRQYSTGSYKYGFQGQEKDDEVKGRGNSVNFKYRMHDPRIGRFFAVDPLAGKYPYLSSYSFSGNRVIDMIELEGAEPTRPKYQWTVSNVKEYKHGTQMIADGWHVFLSVSREGTATHQYRDPNTGVWKSFEPTTPEAIAGDVSYVATTAIFATGIGVGGPAIMGESGIAGFLLKEGAESVIEELTGIPIVPINPDPTDLSDPWINKGVRTMLGGFDANAVKHLAKDFAAKDRYIDCSDFAKRYANLAPGGKIIELTPKKGAWMKGVEYGETESFQYHQFYLKDGHVYDPMYGPEPIPYDTYIENYQILNPDGFNIEVQ